MVAGTHKRVTETQEIDNISPSWQPGETGMWRPASPRSYRPCLFFSSSSEANTAAAILRSEKYAGC